MISEVKKAIYTHIVNGWDRRTPILFRNASADSSQPSWLRVHLLENVRRISRRRDTLADLILNVSLFSSENNEYELDDLEQNLQSLLEQKNIESDHYLIEFREFETTNMQDNRDNLQKTLQFKSINIPIFVQKKR